MRKMTVRLPDGDEYTFAAPTLEQMEQWALLRQEHLTDDPGAKARLVDETYTPDAGPSSSARRR